MTEHKPAKPTDRVYLDTAQAAELLKMAAGTLNNWRYSQPKATYDGPPYTKIGGKVFYEQSALYRWLDRQTVGEMGRPARPGPSDRQAFPLSALTVPRLALSGLAGTALSGGVIHRTASHQALANQGSRRRPR